MENNEKILVAVKLGTWNGLIEYVYDWGYETIKGKTADGLFNEIFTNLEAFPETRGLSDRLIAAGYEDGDEVRLNGYREFDEMGELYEVHEITLVDCQRTIDHAKEN